MIRGKFFEHASSSADTSILEQLAALSAEQLAEQPAAAAAATAVSSNHFFFK